MRGRFSCSPSLLSKVLNMILLSRNSEHKKSTMNFPESLHLGNFLSKIYFSRMLIFRRSFAESTLTSPNTRPLAAELASLERGFSSRSGKSRNIIKWSYFIGCSTHVQQVYLTSVKENMKKSPSPSGAPKESRGSSSSSLRRVLGRAAFSSLTRQNNNETSKNSSTGSSKWKSFSNAL